jgi:hypothetical protein
MSRSRERVQDLEREAEAIANALHFLGEALEKFDAGDLTSVPGLAVIVNHLAYRADDLYGTARLADSALKEIHEIATAQAAESALKETGGAR